MTRRTRLRLALLLAFASILVAIAPMSARQAAGQTPDWTEPYPPFRIADNLYYVGSTGLANYLITTPQGHILINSDLEANVPLIRASVEKLGFKYSDIKILLISHAHWDHDAGSATIKRQTGATYMVMDADVPVVESGGTADFRYGTSPDALYPATKVDRVLHDGDEVRLGGAILTAHLTPGHTKGCTTWTMKVRDGGKSYDAVIVGSPNINAGYKLVNNAQYPQIADDYERMFKTLKALPCDIFLGAHGSYFNMDAKYARMKPGAPNPFIDAEGYKRYVAQKEQDFRAELAKQRGLNERPSAQIAAAEAEGAEHSRVSSAASTTEPARTCTTIRPDQIVFPTTKAGDSYVQSGDFEAVSISFGWDQTYEQAKMPLVPRHPEAIGTGLRIRLTRLDEVGYAPPYELPGFNARTIGSGAGFFASWPKFPTPGTWMMIVTAGANWGCFVLNRPVRTSSKH